MSQIREPVAQLLKKYFKKIVSFVCRLKTTSNRRVSNLRIFTETIDVLL